MGKSKKFKKNKKKFLRPSVQENQGQISPSQQAVKEQPLVEEQKVEIPVISQEELEREKIFSKLQAEIRKNQKAIDEGKV